jgi:hypothetical protein
MLHQILLSVEKLKLAITIDFPVIDIKHLVHFFLQHLQQDVQLENLKSKKIISISELRMNFNLIDLRFTLYSEIDVASFSNLP